MVDTIPGTRWKFRRLGIVRFSDELFNQCVERGFPFPGGTCVRGVRHDDWTMVFYVLVHNDSFDEIPEGHLIPTYELIVDTIKGTSRFCNILCAKPIAGDAA